MNEQRPDHRSFGKTVPNWHGALILLAAPSFLAGCGAGTPEAPRVIQRDSAGIVIVENAPGMELNAGGWSVDQEPFLTIGSVDGDEGEFLYEVTGAHGLPEGGVAILNAGTTEIRVYDNAGNQVTTIGRRGEGPGEFTWMRLAGTIGNDTLVVLDSGLRRMSLVHPEAGFLRSAFVEPEVTETLYASGVFGDGLVLFGSGARTRYYEGVQEGMSRPPATYRVCDLEGRLVGELGEKPGLEVELQVVESRADGQLRVRNRSHPLARLPEAAARGNRFYFGPQDTFEIEAMDPNGRLLRLFRVLEDPVPVTAEAWARYVDERIEATARDADHEARRRRFFEGEREFLPPTFPAHGTLKVDPLDHLWVEEYRLPGEESLIWSVFNPDGIRLARVTLPPGMDVLEIGSDRIIGLVKDEYDVEFVHLFRLRRGE